MEFESDFCFDISKLNLSQNSENHWSVITQQKKCQSKRVGFLLLNQLPFVKSAVNFCCSNLNFCCSNLLIKRNSRSMVVFIYHLYIVFWGGYMLPTTFYDTQKQPLTRNGFDKRLFLLLPGAFCSCQPLSWNSRIQRTKQQEVLMSIYTCTAIFQCTYVQTSNATQDFVKFK